MRYLKTKNPDARSGLRYQLVGGMTRRLRRLMQLRFVVLSNLAYLKSQV